MMRRSHRNALIALAVALAAVAAWAFQNQTVWLPGATEWAQKTWRGMTRPDASSRATVGAQPAATSSKAPSAADQPAPRRPRKCTGSDGHVSYTDQSCPAGTQEQWFDDANGAVVQSVPDAKSPARK